MVGGQSGYKARRKREREKSIGSAERRLEEQKREEAKQGRRRRRERASEWYRETVS